jgi:hypothetical protein
MAKHYANLNKKSPRYKQHYTLDPTSGAHIYKKPGGKRVSIGGKPYDPLQPLTGKGFNQEVKAQTNLKYAPQEQEIASQQRVSGANTARIGGYYDNYRAQLADLRNQTQAAYAQAQAQAGQQANTARTQDQARTDLNQAQSQKSAQLRGTTAQGGQEADQAAAARQAINNAGAAQIGSQGAAQYAYRAGIESAAGAGKIQALGDEAARGRQLDLAKRNLAGEKGQYAGQVRGQLRDTERTYALNRQAYGLQVQKELSTEAHQKRQDQNVKRGQNLISRDKRTKNRLKQIDQQLKSQSLSETQRHNLATERTTLYKALHPSKGKSGSGLPSGITPTKAKSHQIAFENAVQAYQGQKDFNKVYGLAQKHRKAPKDLAEAIALRAIGRYPSKKTASKLFQKYGVRMKSK